MTTIDPYGLRNPGPSPTTAGAPGPTPARPPGRLARLAETILPALLLRLVLALVLLAGGGALLARVRAGVVTKPVPIAPGIVAEQGSGAWLYAIRLRDGVALVDAGRDVKGRPIDAALAPLGARRSDVTDVLLTHGHPSETVGLAAVRGARVHAGVGDVAVITGREHPGRGVDKLVGLMLPRTRSEVEDPIPAETALEVGGERVLAIPVPGHSLGSVAYLIRGVLFVGDAASIRDGRLVPGPRFMSEDPRASERALVHLARRVAGEDVDRVCSAHAGCSAPGAAGAMLHDAGSRSVDAGR